MVCRYRKKTCNYSNFETIGALELEDYELDAVIAHELGHIVNDPNSNIENYDTQKEYYADYFVKSIGLKLPLIGSIQKYLSQENAENRALFNQRIDCLNGDEIFVGAIKMI
jgi:hypothetical protein